MITFSDQSLFAIVFLTAGFRFKLLTFPNGNWIIFNLCCTFISVAKFYVCAVIMLSMSLFIKPSIG